MADYRSMFDRELIGAWDLSGKDVTVEIVKVEAKILNNGKTKNKKPIIYFKGKSKGFAANKTNCKTIAAMYGNDTTQWVGKLITIFATTTDVGGETVDCIRVRSRVGNGKKAEPDTSPDQAEDETPEIGGESRGEA